MRFEEALLYLRDGRTIEVNGLLYKLAKKVWFNGEEIKPIGDKNDFENVFIACAYSDGEWEECSEISVSRILSDNWEVYE